MVTFFCPNCFIKLPATAVVCPNCGINIESWQQQHSYLDKLIHSLKHPISEARMGCIITLGNLRNPKAAIPLAECALTYSIDVWQAMEIIRSLRKLPDSPEKETAFKMLLEHPSSVIREEAATSLMK